MAFVDVVRFVEACLCLWLAALMTRLAWIRWTSQRTVRKGGDPDPRAYVVPDPFSTWSYALALVAVAQVRFLHLGRPISGDFWLGVAVVGFGLFGVLRKWRIGLERDERREGRRRGRVGAGAGDRGDGQ